MNQQRGRDTVWNRCVFLFGTGVLCVPWRPFNYVFVFLSYGPVQTMVCFSQPFHPPPILLAPCHPFSKASLLPSSQNSWLAEPFIHPSCCILSETNSFLGSLQLWTMPRPSTGPGVLQDRRVVVEVEGKLGREQLLTPLVAAGFGKSHSFIKQIEMRKMTIGKCQIA